MTVKNETVNNEAAAAEVAVAGHNEVRLVGRVSQEARTKELPSGDTLLTFRVVVPREPRAIRGPRGQRVDALECVAWLSRVRRSVSGWREGDTVEVSGALRRRFFGAGAVRASRVEVEVSSARLLRRATSG